MKEILTKTKIKEQKKKIRISKIFPDIHFVRNARWHFKFNKLDCGYHK